MKKVLIISYTFPPKPGIGGRRWAKFAKYLVLQGVEVHVLCADFWESKSSEWYEDVKDMGINVVHCNTGVPDVFDKPIKTFFDKIMYRYWKFYSRIVSKGRIFDKAFFWKDRLIEKAEAMIEDNGIKNVICTIPPYRLAYYIAFLKERNSSVNFILDYRDPWTDNKTFHEFSGLSNRRFEYEKKMELFALDHADIVIATTDQMTLWNKNKTGNPDKCITIPNGYDLEDILLKDKVDNTGKYYILFAGNLYDYLDYVFIPFIKYIKQKEAQDPYFKARYIFKFFGNIPDKYVALAKQFKITTFKFEGFIPYRKLKQEYVKADAFMMYSVADHGFNFNTKFYEYISYRKPIFHFSNQGAVTNFLEKNNVGVGLSPLDLVEKLDKVFNDIKFGNFKFNENFDSSDFQVDVISKKIYKILK